MCLTKERAGGATCSPFLVYKKIMNKIPIWYYVARNNPEGAKIILDAWNVKPKSNAFSHLAESLRQLYTQNKEAVLMDLANLHPDKELVVAVAGMQEAPAEPENKSGCDACGGKCGERKSGACGCQSSFAGAWNPGDGMYYSPNRNPNVDEFAVYGFDGKKKANDNAVIVFGAIGLFLAFQLYRNG